MSIDDSRRGSVQRNNRRVRAERGPKKTNWLRNGLARPSLYSRISSTRRHRRRQLSRLCSILPRWTGLEQPHLGPSLLYQHIAIENNLFLGTPSSPSRWSLLPSRLLLSTRVASPAVQPPRYSHCVCTCSAERLLTATTR